MWGGEGCWFGGELWFPLYMKTIHYLSLAQMNTIKKTRNKKNLFFALMWAIYMSRHRQKVEIPLTWFSEEIQTHPRMSPTGKKKKTLMQPHTFTYTHTYLKSGLRKNNKFIQQQNSTDGICCDNIHNTFKREPLTLTDLKLDTESNQLLEECCILTKMAAPCIQQTCTVKASKIKS